MVVAHAVRFIHGYVTLNFDNWIIGGVLFMDGVEIKALDRYPGFEAVFDAEERCIGLVFHSNKFPFLRAFFSCTEACIYYGMTSEEAVQAYFDS